MIFFEKTIAAVVSAAAIGAAVAVAIVSASFAVYALLEPRLGPAAAAASLSGGFALLALIIGVVAARRAEGKKRHHAAADSHDGAGLLSRLMELAKDKPLVAAGAAVAVGIVALRNPAILTAVISAFVAGNNTPPPKR